MLSASYGKSLKTITSRKDSNCFLQLGISPLRYYAFWSALSGSTNRSTTESIGSIWLYKPSPGNSLIGEVEQKLAAINSRLFIPNATICSLDDDHIRLSSRAVTNLTNLQSLNNPEKVLGHVNDAIGSAQTSVYLAGRFSRNEEKQIDIWKRLIQLLQGTPTEGAIKPMMDTLFASDRACNSTESIRFINESISASGICTHKRTLFFPLFWVMVEFIRITEEKNF